MDNKDVARELASLHKKVDGIQETLTSLRIYCAGRSHVSKLWSFLGGILGGLAAALGLRQLD